MYQPWGKLKLWSVYEGKLFPLPLVINFYKREFIWLNHFSFWSNIKLKKNRNPKNKSQWMKLIILCILLLSANNWGHNNNKRSIAYASEVDKRAINLTLGGKLRMSKQIRPPVSILGWYIGVANVTIGGWNGYLGSPIIH